MAKTVELVYALVLGKDFDHDMDLMRKKSGCQVCGANTRWLSAIKRAIPFKLWKGSSLAWIGTGKYQKRLLPASARAQAVLP